MREPNPQDIADTLREVVGQLAHVVERLDVATLTSLQSDMERWRDEVRKELR